MQYLFLLVDKYHYIIWHGRDSQPHRASSYTGCLRMSYPIFACNVVYFISVGLVTKLVTDELETACTEAVVT